MQSSDTISAVVKASLENLVESTVGNEEEWGDHSFDGIHELYAEMHQSVGEIVSHIEDAPVEIEDQDIKPLLKATIGAIKETGTDVYSADVTASLEAFADSTLKEKLKNAGVAVVNFIKKLIEKVKKFIVHVAKIFDFSKKEITHLKEENSKADEWLANTTSQINESAAKEEVSQKETKKKTVPDDFMATHGEYYHGFLVKMGSKEIKEAILKGKQTNAELIREFKDKVNDATANVLGLSMGTKGMGSYTLFPRSYAITVSENNTARLDVAKSTDKTFSFKCTVFNKHEAEDILDSLNTMIGGASDLVKKLADILDAIARDNLLEHRIDGDRQHGFRAETIDQTEVDVKRKIVDMVKVGTQVEQISWVGYRHAMSLVKRSIRLRKHGGEAA